MSQDITVKVPATSANIGSGFDALGLALSLYNEVSFRKTDEGGLSLVVEGLGQGKITTDFERNLVGQAMLRAALVNDKTLPENGVITLFNRIPLARGLGSSSAAVVGGLLLGNELTGRGMDENQILHEATLMEGHPDNAAPALLGGLCMSVTDEKKKVSVQTFALDEGLSFITVSPDKEVRTADARAALPQTINYHDAVFNVAHVAFLVGAFIGKRYDLLRTGLQDKLHMPYRLPLIPGGAEALAAAEKAGAVGATVSGSGSTLIAFAVKGEERIAQAMKDVFKGIGLASVHHILKACNDGAQIVCEDKR